jgi:type VI secretion system protein ImpF
MHAFRAANAAGDAKKKLDLRDAGGERVIAGRRLRGRAAISESVLRQEVGRDLDALMNAINLESTLELDGFDEVRRSVLNHGFADITHRSIDEIGVDGVADEIRTALRSYEPRLVPDTVEVRRESARDGNPLSVRFVIRADLACDPVNVPVEFIADLEVDTCKIKLSRA